jgi:hypothetical protein
MQKLLNSTSPTASPDAIATPEAVATKSPRAIANELHDIHHFTGLSYTGLSKPRNSGISKAANVATSKATARTFAQLTDRMHKTLSEIARGYAASFPLIGIDRGQLAIFINSGFIIANGSNGTLSTETRKRYTPAATLALPPPSTSDKPAKRGKR